MHGQTHIKFNLATGKITHFEMKIWKKTLFFSGVGRRRFVSFYRRFGVTYWYHH